jgi:hypothetical protein
MQMLRKAYKPITEMGRYGQYEGNSQQGRRAMKGKRNKAYVSLFLRIAFSRHFKGLVREYKPKVA